MKIPSGKGALKCRSSLVLGAVIFVAVAGTPARATDPTAKCKATKLKAAGKEVSAKMVCYEKAKKAGAAVDSRCLSNAQAKGDVGISTCANAGTTTEIDAAVNGCVTVFLVDDPNDGDCPAASAKAIGRGAKGELGCQAKDVRKPGTFAACDANEMGRRA